MTRRLLPGLCILVITACGSGGASSGGGGGGGTTTVASAGTPRPGGAVQLLDLVPANAATVLDAHLDVVRGDPGRYDRIAGQLATELGLSAESAQLRALLDRTDRALGVFVPSASGQGQEGMLVFAGSYADSDFQSALSIASARHGSTPAPTAGADGRQIYAMGDATVAKLDQWTWAIAVGPQMRAHLGQVPLGGARSFRQNLLEFGARIGLPSGSAQAWADQDQQVGVDMVALVFAGETPTMVHDFVATVQRHLGL